jgi:hypothetical protein
MTFSMLRVGIHRHIKWNGTSFRGNHCPPLSN